MRDPRPNYKSQVAAARPVNAVEVVARTGPWSGPRPGSPRKDETRLTFLTPGGRHVGEGPTKKLYDDPIGGPVLKGATLLLTEITART